MLHTNNRLQGDGKVNTGVTTKHFDLFIQADKKILFILEFRSIIQSSFVFNLLEQENERTPDRSCSSA
jgi:hypothetical protein